MPYPYISNPYNNHPGANEILSAITFDFKKLDSKNKFVLCSVPTRSQIVADVSAEKVVISEILNYLRYTAAIRALRYNCEFVNKAIHATTPEDIYELTTLTFDYKNSNNYNAIRTINPRVPISLKEFRPTAVRVLKDSKQIIETLEGMLKLDALKNKVPDFDKKFEKAIELKEKCFVSADKLIYKLSNNKNVLDPFINYITNPSTSVVDASKTDKI